MAVANTVRKARSKSAEPKPRTVVLSIRKAAIQCTPDSGKVLEKFRKDPKNPLSGFTLTTGTVRSATVEEGRITDLTVDFQAIHREPITGAFREFRLDPLDRQLLCDAVSRATRTEVAY